LLAVIDVSMENSVDPYMQYLQDLVTARPNLCKNLVNIQVCFVRVAVCESGNFTIISCCCRTLSLPRYQIGGNKTAHHG
jgi:hypothetical protein